MVTPPTLMDRELALPAFVRDLRSFLSLSEDILLAISDIGEKAEGFTGFEQAQSLKSRFDIPVDQAAAHLQIAEHLYHRVAQSGLDVSDAIAQIDAVASGLQNPVSLDDKRREALSRVLSFKRDYEISTAVGTALADGPHFITVNGSWSVRPVKIRNGEAIRVPIIALSIVWHDSTGTNHETFFQMSEIEWEEFNSKVAAFAENRGEMQAILQEDPTTA